MVAVEGTEGRNPFEQLMLLWSALSVLSVLVPPNPNSVLADLDRWVVVGCYILLCIGGLVGLVGVWLRKLILSLLVERAAMIIVGPSALFFSAAILAQVPHNARALSSGLIILFFSLSAFWRGYRIQSYLRKYRATISEAANE